mmetsp:Transcript_20778/g.40789  ORF Transcript_20778/g.40789 Transcript_20778/m.40789 type:complete len:83 (+) Transcript_20778:926-1174(+)
MTFVYQGAGKKQRAGTTDPCLTSRRCQKLACDIQWCLSRNNYNEAKCQDFVQRWEACCESVRAKAAAEKQAKSGGATPPESA